MSRATLGDIRLRGVINIDQYIIEDRFLTILGEIHLRNIDDIEGNITVPEYAKKYSWDNIYLETPAVSPLQETTQSYNINTISQLAAKSPEFRKKISGIDSRISYFDNNYLYGPLNDSISLNEFISKAYGPLRITEMWEQKFVPSNYSEKNHRYLNVMMQDVRDKIHQFEIIFLKPIRCFLKSFPNMNLGHFRTTKYAAIYDPKSNLNYNYIFVLRDIWAKIADFEAMLEILKESNKQKKLLLLFGEEHAKNFNTIFKAHIIFSYRDYGNNNLQSVSLKGSYV